MQHTRSSNNKINKLQERSLRIFYEDYTKKTKIRQFIRQILKNWLLKYIKIKNNIAPKIVSDLFPVNNNYYSLRTNPDFVLSRPKIVGKRTESIRYLGPKIWHDSPENGKLKRKVIKDADSANHSFQI